MHCTSPGAPTPKLSQPYFNGDNAMTTPSPRLQKMLSVEAVAERLTVSTKTVRRWIERHELSVHRLGKSIRVSESDLSGFLNRHREQ
jgi:excisionase family DNA binding protein